MTKNATIAKHYEYTDRWGDPITVFFTKTNYAMGNALCIECYCQFVDEYDGEVHEEPYAPVTVNFGNTVSPDLCFVDMNNSGHLIGWMISGGLATLTGISVCSGFCEYPQVRFSPAFMDGLLDLDELSKEG